MKHYHFIGIGGIGMSALARILLSRGQKVTGSDLSFSSTVQQLKEEGAHIFIGHDVKNIEQPHYVIYSTQVASDNPELLAAQAKGISIIHRSELLALLMNGYAPLLVTGTHGKTTTSSLLANMLYQSNLDPSYAIGGIVRGLGSNARHGKGMYFAAEADESDGSFLNYPSFGAIITNLDNDHLSYWHTEEALIEGFKKFGSKVGSRHHLFWCKDDYRLSQLGLKGYGYGFSEDADLRIDNFQQIEWKCYFDLTFGHKHYREIEIPLIGAHNVLNAAAVFGMGIKLDIPIENIRRSFLCFEGVGRRLEKKGHVGSIDIYDDYAHHPTEIFATLRALKSATHGRRLIVVFQPHRYTRTRDCIDEFPEVFDYADVLILTDIYDALEPPIEGITTKVLFDKISKKKSAVHYVQRSNISQYLEQFIQPQDVVITMGAGDITQVGPELTERLKKHEKFTATLSS